MLNIGDAAEYAKKITLEDVKRFAELTGDDNPIHVNAELAAKTIFGEQIAHGLLIGSMIGKIIGTILPGYGTIYLEQNFKFIRPVHINDSCKSKVEVVEVINCERGIYRLSTVVENQKGDFVIDGYAIVKYKDNGRK